MQPTPAELERIVEAVLARVSAAVPSPSRGAGDSAVASVASSSQSDAPSSKPDELILKDRVVTLSTVESKLANIRSVLVHPRAIVTPAVNDLLRQRSISLIRRADGLGSAVTASRATTDTQSGGANSADKNRLAPVLVCGSAVWFASLTKQLCPKQSTVAAGADSDVLGMIEHHFRLGGRKSLWISPAPFAAAVMSQRASSRAIAHVPSMLELSVAIQQAQPDVIIIDSHKWTVAAVGNLVRQWLRGV